MIGGYGCVALQHLVDRVELWPALGAGVLNAAVGMMDWATGRRLIHGPETVVALGLVRS